MNWLMDSFSDVATALRNTVMPPDGSWNTRLRGLSNLIIVGLIGALILLPLLRRIPGVGKVIPKG